ncbi:MnhB domain-containing protein [Thalassiella azotivora]
MSASPAGTPRLRESVVLQTALRLVFHAIAATALFFLFAGHNAPGGGFIGGLVAGTAFVLRYLVGGENGIGRLRVAPTTVLGTGLVVAAGTAVVPWFAGGQVLESGYAPLDLPVVGTLPLTSVLAFDTGVFLIVVGLVLLLLDTLGSREDAAIGEIEPEEDAR